METPASKMTWKNTLKGILFLPALSFILNPVKAIYILVSLLFMHGSLKIGLNIAIVTWDILISLFFFYMAYIYFNRKKILPSMYILVRILVFIFITFVFITSNEYSIAESSKTKIVFEYFGSIIGCLFFIPLFVYSKKAKEIFTEELTDKNFIERSAKKIEKFLNGLFSFVLKIKKLLFPLIIFFIALVTGLAIVIVSLF